MNSVKWMFFILLPVVILVFGLMIGRFDISIDGVWEAVVCQSNCVNLVEKTIVWDLRLPRLLVAFLVGSGLAVSGVVYQAVFRNPLASPDILGVSSGSAFGGVMGLWLGLSIYGVWGLSLIFGIMALLFTLLLAKRGSNYRLGFVLGGLVVGSLFGALISVVKILADPYDQLPSIVFWLMGSLAKSEWNQLEYISLPILTGLFMINLMRWRVNLLAMGLADVGGLGLNLRQNLIVILVLVTGIVSVIISAVGVVGWIGLIIPHLARLVVGNNHKVLVPMALIMGGSLMMVIDILARSLSSQEIPVGILSAIVGASVFVVIWQLKIKHNYV